MEGEQQQPSETGAAFGGSLQQARLAMGRAAQKRLPCLQLTSRAEDDVEAARGRRSKRFAAALQGRKTFQEAGSGGSKTKPSSAQGAASSSPSERGGALLSAKLRPLMKGGKRSGKATTCSLAGKWKEKQQDAIMHRVGGRKTRPSAVEASPPLP